MSARQRRPNTKAAASAGRKRSSDSIVTNAINKFPRRNNTATRWNRHSDNAISDPGYDSGDDSAYENAHNYEVETEDERDPVHVQGRDGGSSNQTNIAFEPEQPLRQRSKGPQMSSGTPSSQQWVRSNTSASLGRDQSFNTHNSTHSSRVSQSESQIESSSFMSVDGDEEQGHGLLAWGNVTRRQVTHLSTPLLSNNSTIGKEVLYIVVAKVFSGHDTNILKWTMWPEYHHAGLSDLILDTWEVERDGMIHSYSRNGQPFQTVDIPSEIPSQVEARWIRDQIGEIRSHMLSKVRLTVHGKYNFQGMANCKEYVTALMKHDCFACDMDNVIEDESAGYRRWLAPILIQCIVDLSFGAKGRYALARHPSTRGYFDPFPLNALLITATMVYHAITEYSGGSYVTAKFDASVVADTYSRLKNTWQQQTSERARLTLDILRSRIKKQAGPLAAQDSARADTIRDKYMDRLDDLPVAEIGLNLTDLAASHDNQATDDTRPTVENRELYN